MLIPMLRDKYATWLITPLVIGLVFTGLVPISNANAAKTFPIKTPNDAKTWGLDSLGSMMSSFDGQPLILDINKNFKVPLPSNLSDFVKNRKAALVLGKALFWDMQVGSDGIQACASCHFQAGADIRSKNQVSTQGRRVLDRRDGEIKGYFFSPADPDTTFETVFGRTWAPNFKLFGKDFPLVITQNALIRAGESILPDTYAGNRNDVVGSMGVAPATFAGIVPGRPVDQFVPGTVGPIRPVTSRQAPPAINAVFNLLQFWDGRADTRFNGFNPIGRHDLDNPRYFVNVDGTLQDRGLQMELASLASQATGPPVDATEMSYAGRVWPDIGMKLLRPGPKGPLTPLAYQRVHQNDSVLGAYRGFLGYGLNTTYSKLIKAAFKDELWNNTTSGLLLPNGVVHGEDYYNQGSYTYVEPDTPGAYTQMEANFSLFWGLAVMLYEAELVSHQSKFDRWMEGKASLSSLELAGLNIFVQKGKCINCHGGPEFTNATVRNTQNGKEQIEPIIKKDGTPAFYDNGFYNVGMDTTVDDLQRGSKDTNGFPWGNARQFLFQKNNIQNIPFDIIGLPIQNLIAKTVDGKVELRKIDEEEGIDILVCYDLDNDGKCGLDDDIVIESLDQDGNCKASSLRNADLTGPYFHNGGAATLQQVVDNYDMGGHFNKFPLNKADMLPDIDRLNLSDTEQKSLVAFLLTLTDSRVRSQKAPFDHPDLYIPINGKLPALDATRPLTYFMLNMTLGKIKLLPAVGKTGGGSLSPFLNLSPFAQDTGKGKPIED